MNCLSFYASFCLFVLSVSSYLPALSLICSFLGYCLLLNPCLQYWNVTCIFLRMWCLFLSLLDKVHFLGLSSSSCLSKCLSKSWVSEWDWSMLDLQSLVVVAQWTIETQISFTIFFHESNLSFKYICLLACHVSM